jgi:hypothetical protein
MADVNPDPHEYGYVFVPQNRITAIFSSQDDVRGAVKDLEALGIEPQNVDVFVGPEGAAALDLSGEGHGPITRQLRNFEALMVLVAGESHRRADAALKSGAMALAVLLDGKEESKPEVAALLKVRHATLVRYWGRWTVESLD